MTPLLRLSATRLARMIKEGETTSRAVVDAHIDRIERVNGRLNAVVAPRFDAARREADLADDAVKAARGDAARLAALPTLHGVPCTIKEAFALEGMPNSGGLWARRDVRAKEDATAVKRLRAAGAIPLGVTNLSELCMWMESSNRVYGRTTNAYDPKRTAGGSSGGEGAIVGAGGAPFGLGSDVGGSIRMPAFFNGVFGHKPTGTRVPNSGQFPCSGGQALRFLTTGPLCRRAEDLAPLLTILEGPDGIDAECKAWPRRSAADVDMSRVRVLDVESNGRLAPSATLVAAQKRAAGALERLGARVEEARFERLRRSLEIWSAMLGSAEPVTFRTLMGNGAKFRPGLELGRWALRRSMHTLPGIMLALVEGVTKLSPRQTSKFIEMGHALKQEIVDLLGDDGVMLFPPYPTVAPRHHEPLLVPIKYMYTAVFNVLELPVTQVPLGLDSRGLPLGVQVIAKHGNDHLTIAVAMALEKELGGWVMPGG